MRLNIFADGKLYIGSTIHSPLNPKFRGAPFICLNATTGEPLWRISLFRCGWGCEPLVADGIIVALDNYDNRIYAFGKGPSKTTVTAPQTAISLGSSVMITGTVTDQSPGTDDYDIKARYPNGVPAISDEDMDAWMEHLYRQFSKPVDAKGVRVHLTAIDPNGNFQDIGYATTDIHGNFGISWTPPVPGVYHVTATFEGSKSYYRSEATTYFVVEEAPAAAQPIEPEQPEQPTEPEQPEQPTQPEQPEAPTEPEQPTEAPLITTELAIVIAVVVACVVGVASLYLLRRRK